MNATTTSPTTYGFEECLTDAASPRTYPMRFDVPTTEQACDRLLANAEHAARSPENGTWLATELARFLGASSRVWTQARRAQLRSSLVKLGNDGLRATLGIVAAVSNAQVEDEAERVLRGFGPTIGDLLAGVVEGKPIAFEGLATLRQSPAVLATAIRVLVALRSVYALGALRKALHHESPEVRDAAAQGLGQLGAREALLDLERRLENETNAVVRESIEAVRAELADVR